MRKNRLLLAFGLLTAACSHIPLSANDLNEVHRPAFIARVDENAGPKAEVFREDSTFRQKLKRLDPREADRRLAVKLSQAVTRFEVAERVRAGTFARISKERPWSDTVSAATVASALESFLVEDVPAHPPDYELLRPLGVDAVVEFVIEEYGMRSEDGKAGVFAHGYGRMFRLDGGQIWRKSFDVDQVDAKTASLDPFKVGKNPELFRGAMREVLETVAADFAQELGVRQGPAAPSQVPEGNELEAPPDDTNKTGKPPPAELDEKPSGTGRTPSGDSSEIRMKERRERSEEERPATAPGLQDPSQAPSK
jgi:hypothetical protein